MDPYRQRVEVAGRGLSCERDIQAVNGHVRYEAVAIIRVLIVHFMVIALSLGGVPLYVKEILQEFAPQVGSLQDACDRFNAAHAKRVSELTWSHYCSLGDEKVDYLLR